MPQTATRFEQEAGRPPEYGTRQETPVKTPVEARQAVTGHNASVVLIVSTLAVIVAFALIYLVFFAH